MAKRKTKLGKSIEKRHEKTRKRILELRIARLQGSMDKAAAKLVADMAAAQTKLTEDIAAMKVLADELAAIVAAEVPPVVEPAPVV